MRALFILLALFPVLLWASPKNIIVMVPDGTGHASLTVARQLKGEPLTLDRAIYGIVQTRSADNSTTDSAAAATAMSCGERTYNGAVAVNTARVPLCTFAEWAHAQGKAAGIVTTDTIVGATPAAFSVHATHRSEADAIIEQQIASGFEVFMGGGRKHLTQDRKHFLAQQGYTLVTTDEELRAAKGSKLFGLFAEDVLTAKVARRNGKPCSEPTLPDMTAKALEVLAADPEGFFLLIEGAQVDKGNHDNDLPWATYELLEFDDTVAQVLAWTKEHPGTVVLIAPDHETGGLTLQKEPKEGARAQALKRVTAQHVGKPKDYFVHYSTGGHTGVDVFLAGNDPSVRFVRNCDLRPTIVGAEAKTLKELPGKTEVIDGVPYLITPEGKRLRAHREAIYIPSTGKWYTR